MDIKKFRVQVQNDYLDKVASGKPIASISEVIWNALDAEATRVDINFNEGLLGVDAITVNDNGHGIDHNQAEQLFSSLGGSWKKNTEKSTNKGRFLHGQEGKGRFKSFALGRITEWNIRYRKNDTIFEYNIIGKADDITYFSISTPEISKNSSTGVTVKISELHKQYKLFDIDYAIEKLSPIFAIYLMQYNDCSINIAGKSIDPLDLIQSRKTYELDTIVYDDKNYPYSLEIIEWNAIHEKDIQLCNEHGFPIERYEKQIKGIGDYSFTAYIKSNHISELNKKGLLSLIDLEPSLQPVLIQAISTIKNHFIEKKLSESQHIIDIWKKEDIYPNFDSDELNINYAQSKLFDIVAINVSENIPNFEKLDHKSKKFQFRLLKQAIEKSPEELQMIITEVLQLPDEKRNDLASLLKETSLASIISASKTVSDRLKFLAGLENLIYTKDTKKVLKERSQLHKILSKNTWIFGDAFSLTVNDQSLTEVLVQHKKYLNENIIIDEPVLRLDDKVGIVDLMLSQAIGRNHPDEKEHLIIELKAPIVKIGKKEIGQIEEYAFAVIADERFRHIKTKWTFCVISNDLDDHAKMKRKQSVYRDGVIYKSNEDGVDVTILIKTWSEIFQECKHRMLFIKSQLNLNLDSSEGLSYLKDKYSAYTKGVFIAENSLSES